METRGLTNPLDSDYTFNGIIFDFHHQIYMIVFIDTIA
jgi:hypothetical protein